MPHIRVKNFQSLRNASLEVKGFTALTGPNNSGKTALMRAIQGVFQNTPGTAFVRHGEEEFQVSIEFEDASVMWSKGVTSRSKPTYVVNGGLPIFPGREVPDEVKALGVVPIEAGGREVWPTLAPQFTGQVFLLDRPGSHLAEAVADIERVSQLNTALKQSEKERRAKSAELKVRRVDLEKAEEGLAAYQGLDEVLEALSALAEERAQADRVRRTHQKLVDFANRLRAQTAILRQLEPVGSIEVPEGHPGREAFAQLEECLRLRNALGAASHTAAQLDGVSSIEIPSQDTASELRSGLAVSKRLAEELGAQRKTVARLSAVAPPPSLEAEFVQAQKVSEAVRKVEGYRYSLQAAMLDVEDISASLLEKERASAQAEAEVQTLVKEWGVCPTCGKGH